MTQRFVFPLFLLLVVLLLTGCARTVSVTEVAADGSLTRTLTFRGGRDKDNTAKPEANTADFSGPSLGQLVRIPRGAGWSVQRGTDKSGQVITATRRFAPGETIEGDIGVRAAPKSPMTANQKTTLGALLVSNTVVVRQIEPGMLEYRETLHWRGKPPEAATVPEPKLLATIRAALPASVAGDTALSTDITLHLQRETLHLIFGPGEPLLPLLIFNPDLAEYRLRKRFGHTIYQELVERAGDRLTEAERREIVAKTLPFLKESVTSDSQNKVMGMGGSAGGDVKPKSGVENPPVSLFFRVKMPGKVTRTNGELDDETGEVVWTMYSQAASIEDVTMTAVCETGK